MGRILPLSRSNFQQSPSALESLSKPPYNNRAPASFPNNKDKLLKQNRFYLPISLGQIIFKHKVIEI
jgi:hypothetical protein